MELPLRVGAALIGLLVIVAFLRSVLQVAIVNRQRGDWLARRVGWLVYTILARRALRRQSYAAVQDVLAWVLPLYILLLIVVWFGFVQAGYSLLIWSSQAEHSFLQAVIVRRQSFWDRRWIKIRESLAPLVCNIMRLADGAASGDWRLSVV